MKRISGTELVRSHFPAAVRITNKRLRDAVAGEIAMGWHVCFVPTSLAPDRLVVLIRGTHPFASLFDHVLDEPDVALPLGLVEQRIGARIDTLDACDRLTHHGLIISDLTPGMITLMGACPHLSRVVNYPRYGVPNRGWKVRNVIPKVLGLRECPRKLRDARRLQTGIILDRLDIDASDLCDGQAWTNLRPKWTIDERLSQRDSN